MDTSKAIGIIITNPEFADVRSLKVLHQQRTCKPIVQYLQQQEQLQS